MENNAYTWGLSSNRREAAVYSKQFHFSHLPFTLVMCLLLFISTGPGFMGWIFSPAVYTVLHPGPWACVLWVSFRFPWSCLYGSPAFLVPAVRLVTGFASSLPSAFYGFLLQRVLLLQPSFPSLTGLLHILFLPPTFTFLKNIYLFIWLRWVLVVAWELSISTCRIGPRPPASGAWNLSHWTTREVHLLPFQKNLFKTKFFQEACLN